MKLFKVVFFVFCISCCNILQAKVNNENARLELKISKKRIFPCECYTAKLSFLVYNSNILNMEFQNLSVQIPKLTKQLTPEDAWFFNNNINEVKEVKVHNTNYSSFKLLEIAICPFHEGQIDIPKLKLEVFNIDQNKNKKIISFYSEPKSISVNKLPNAAKDIIYKNDNYYMVGKFKLYETVDTTQKKFIVGDTIDYSLRLASLSGLSFPIGLNIINNEDARIIIDRVDENDSIWLDDLRLSKTFHLKVIPRKKGKLNMGNLIYWEYFYPKYGQVFPLQPKTIFNIQKRGKTQKYSEVKDNISIVLALDISESMLVEDYLPNRLQKGINIVNSLKLMNCNIPLIVFGSTSKVVNECQINQNIRNVVEQHGTAIGNAIYAAIQQLKKSESKFKKIVIIGDGDNTTGCISEVSAAKYARQHEIQITSIGLGSEGKAPFGVDLNGNKRYVENTYNDFSLKLISSMTDGGFIHLDGTQDMNEVLNEILFK